MNYFDLFLRQGFFFKNQDFNKRCEKEIEVSNGKTCSRFIRTISGKIALTANGLHIDKAPAWELKIIFDSQNLTKNFSVDFFDKVPDEISIGLVA